MFVTKMGVMKKILCLLLLLLFVSCHKKMETEIMMSNIIERYGNPVETDKSARGVLWYKFKIDPSKANTESVKGTIDKSLNMLPTEMRGSKYEMVSYTWETPQYIVRLENDFEGEINLEDLKKSTAKIIIKIWVTNK